MELHSFIIHKIIKAKESNIVHSFPRSSLISVNNLLANTLVTEIMHRFQKDPSHTFAKFGQQSNLANDIALILDYKEAEATLEKNQLTKTKNDLFYDLSINLLTNLELELQEDYAKFATGGILAIASITEDNKLYFLVTLLKETNGFAVDEHLELLEVKNIDLNHIHFATKVDIALWKEDQVTFNIDNRYLEFLKGKSRQKVVEYFKKILSIDETTYIDPDNNTKELVKAIQNFCSKTPNIDADSVCRQINEMMEMASNNKESISLRTIAEVITPTNEETQENEFINFLRKHKYKIDGDLTPRPGSFKGLIEIKVDSKNYTLIIKRDGLDHDIIASREKHEIKLRNVPDSHFDRIEGRGS